jgi:hypothetical protein
MLEIGASGSVGGEGGNILVYPAVSGVADIGPALKACGATTSAAATHARGERRHDGAIIKTFLGLP